MHILRSLFLNNELARRHLGSKKCDSRRISNMPWIRQQYGLQADPDVTPPYDFVVSNQGTPHSPMPSVISPGGIMAISLAITIPKSTSLIEKIYLASSVQSI